MFRFPLTRPVFQERRLELVQFSGGLLPSQLDILETTRISIKHQSGCRLATSWANVASTTFPAAALINKRLFVAENSTRGNLRSSGRGVPCFLVGNNSCLPTPGHCQSPTVRSDTPAFIITFLFLWHRTIANDVVTYEQLEWFSFLFSKLTLVYPGHVLRLVLEHNDLQREPQRFSNSQQRLHDNGDEHVLIQGAG